MKIDCLRITYERHKLIAVFTIIVSSVVNNWKENNMDTNSSIYIYIYIRFAMRLIRSECRYQLIIISFFVIVKIIFSIIAITVNSCDVLLRELTDILDLFQFWLMRNKAVNEYRRIKRRRSVRGSPHHFSNK
jgi:hypothetical protein